MKTPREYSFLARTRTLTFIASNWECVYTMQLFDGWKWFEARHFVHISFYHPRLSCATPTRKKNHFLCTNQNTTRSPYLQPILPYHIILSIRSLTICGAVPKSNSVECRFRCVYKKNNIKMSEWATALTLVYVCLTKCLVHFSTLAMFNIIFHNCLNPFYKLRSFHA